MANNHEDATELNVKHDYKEGGWGWLVVVTCAFCFGINIGIMNIYSIIYNELIIVYNSTENHVVYAGWIGSTTTGNQYLFCSISCILVDFFDARKIGFIGGCLSAIGLFACAFVENLKIYFLTYGIIFGIGQSLFLASILSILPHYFNKRLGLANGLMNLGGAFLTISLPFIVVECLKSIGLANTFTVLAGFSFISALLTLTFKPQIKTNFEEDDWKIRIKKSFGLKILKMKKFKIWTFSVFIGFFGYLIPILVISHHSVLNFPSYSPAIVTSILGAVSGLSGVFFGLIGDYVKINAIHFHILSFFVGGFVQIALRFARTFFEFCIVVGFYGVIDGIFLSFIVPISCEVTNSHTLSTQASGFFFFFITLPSIVGPVIASWIFERFGSYSIAYYLGGGSCIFASLFLFLIYPDTILRQFINKRNENKKVIEEETVKFNEITLVK